MVLIKNIENLLFVKSGTVTGYCNSEKDASKFESVFAAMKYLDTQDEDDITGFDFIQDGTGKQRKR